MTEQQENERICELLLGWTESDIWAAKDGFELPTFTTWQEAGLILEAFQSRGEAPKLLYSRSRACWCCEWEMLSTTWFTGQTGPQAVRAAALAYLQ